MRLVFSLLTIVYCCSSYAQLNSRLIPKKGLFISSNDLQWSVGSEINFFTSDKKHHHYFFTWWEQDADSSRPDTDILEIGSHNTAVAGKYSRQQKGNIIDVNINCKWNRADSGLVDIIHTRLWFPFFKEARWMYQQKEISLEDLKKFHDKELEVITNFGHYKFRSDQPFNIKIDANLSPKESDYTIRSQFIQLFESDILIQPNSDFKRNFKIELIQLSSDIIKVDTNINVTLLKQTNAWTSGVLKMEVIPRPSFINLENDSYNLCESSSSVKTKEAEQLRDIIQLNWQIEKTCTPNIFLEKKLSLPKEGYEINITKNRINIQHHTEVGIQHALHTIAQLVYNKGGELHIPTGIIIDSPSISWRGIHMFTGAQSWAFHQKMYERVLLPLKMNKAVIQCEQAEWETLPEIHSRISIPLKDLKSEFEWLRSKHVEPIPLIQSLGHMEWFFKPTNLRKYAVNPAYPYTLNPEIPAARKLVRNIWKEAFKLLEPSVMHVGFDEIGMIGFHLPREKEIDFWKIQINDLNRFAKKRKASLMLWGDMGLGPGEGPDALNGMSKERAETIRNSIPKNSFIADWHYINNDDPSIYITNLKIWKQNNLRPIASPWLHPNNVRGFVLAAQQEQAGVLQTTWADFESSEKNMLLNIEQFGAYILAMDYAWSGRKELPEKLPYNAIKEWNNRFYGQSKPIKNKTGWKIASSVALKNITQTNLTNAPANASYKFEEKMITGFSLKSSTDNIIQEGSAVARIIFLQDNQILTEKVLRYGVELRNEKDERAIFAAIPGKDKKTLFHFFNKNLLINHIQIELLHKGAGFKIEELIMFE